MNKIFNKRNITILKLLAVLGLAVYFIFKAIPKLNDNPSTILLSATIIASIGFSIALFKLAKEIRDESIKDKNKILIIKSTKDKLITILNVLGVILIAFIFLANQFEIISKDTFVFIYAFAGVVLVTLIVLNALNKRVKQGN